MTLPPALQTIMKPVPLPLAQRVAELAFARVLARHPRIFERLGDYARCTYCFAPTDLQLEFAVTPHTGTVRVARPGRILRSHARISGPLVLLLALAEGRVDGDAEFFGRQIAIDGDMEAVLALRNALENDAVDLVKDIVPVRGPLRAPMVKALDRARTYLLMREQRRWS